MDRRVAVVTGGTGTLGRSVVDILLSDGWHVHVPVRSWDEGVRLGERHGGHARLHAAPADLADPRAVDGFFAGIAATEGRLDFLANLAGAFAAGNVDETDPGTWVRMWESNATVPFLAMRAAVPLLRQSGGGAIVNVAAAAAVRADVSGMSAYLAAKSALVSLTQSLAEELAADGIRVNAVAPTIIDTPANRDAVPRGDRKGWLAPLEIAEVIRFLAAQEARVVTGNVIVLRKG